MTITLRSTKGSELTHAELDENFSDLETAVGTIVVPSSYIATLMDDSDASTALTTLGFSAFMKTLVDDADASAALATLGAAGAAANTTYSGANTFQGTTTVVDGIFSVLGSSDATRKLRFEADGITTGTTRVLTAQDEDGTIALTSEFAYSNLAGSAGRMPFAAMWIQGLVPSNNAGDATNDLDFTAGQCRDATNAQNIIVAALTKQSDVAWAVGTNQGMLDSGAVGNNEYYVWAILRSDTGVTDLLSSLSSTAPTMPANYDYKRLVGYFLRAGGTIVAFKAYESAGGGLEWLWSSPTLDINLAATLTTTRRTDAVKVPLTFSVISHLNVLLNDATTGYDAWIYCPDQSDLAPSLTLAPLSNIRSGAAAAVSQQMNVRTSATGTIAARSTLATVDSYAVSTMGFEWTRRN